MTTGRHVLLFVGLTVLLQGCALLSKQHAQVPHYFEPTAEVVSGDAVPVSAAERGLELRLGSIMAASNLRQRIAYRSAPQEVRYYETRRWTETPDVYLRRALERALFEQARLTMVVSGTAPSLTAQLTAFEEIKAAPQRARVEVTIVLEDGTLACLHQTLVAEEPIAPGEGADAAEPMVRAFSRALGRVVNEISSHTRQELLAMKTRVLAGQPACGSR